MMTKPRVYILSWGSWGHTPDLYPGTSAFEEIIEKYPKAKGATQLLIGDCTVGLIEYDKEKGKKYMMLDTGTAGSWDKISRKMKEVGCTIKNVTHILQTHWDEDHFENITRFSPYHPFCIWGGSGPHYDPMKGHILILGAGTYLLTEDLYPNGYVEDENIRYYYTYRAHSRDEMYFIIDSKNEGKVAFIGDLIHAPISERPNIDYHLRRDRVFCLNIFRKYINLKEIYEKHPDLEKIYAGHASGPMTYRDLGDYIKLLERKKYKAFMAEYIQRWKETLSEYEEMLRKM